MESDRFICVREKQDEKNYVLIVDLEDTENVIRRTITADSAIMHPDKKIIALKADKQLQVFDLESKQKLCAHQMSEDVIFWKWLGPACISIVTETAAYHWMIEETGKVPQKIFDRHSSLNGCQIINYRSDSTGIWLLLVGITAQSGRVVGAAQLYNCEKGVSQPLEAHIGTFAELKMDGAPFPTKIFCFAVRTLTGAKLHLVEIDHRQGNPDYPKKSVDVFFPPEATNDFPVAIQPSKKYQVIYLITKYGFIHIYEMETGECLFMNRISSDTIFVSTEQRQNNGIIAVNRRGQILSVVLDETTLIPYIVRNLHNLDLALKFAMRCGLDGAENLFVTRFAQLCEQGQFSKAARLAARSSGGILRIPSTIDTLKAGSSETSGEPAPLLQYFSILMEGSDPLNEKESEELLKLALSQGKKQMLEKCLSESKITCNESLGDLTKQYDLALALAIYLRANSYEKVCQCLVELGEYSRLIRYVQKTGYSPDFVNLLSKAMDLDPVKSVEFAKLLVEDSSIEIYDDQVFDIFADRGLVQQATAVVLEKLKTDTPELGNLQTRLLRLNIQSGAPKVADAILASRVFSHYDKQSIAELCESSGLYYRALEHFNNIDDIMRVLKEKMGDQELDKTWLLTWITQIESTELALDIFKLLLADPNLHGALADTASKLSSKIDIALIAEVFEEAQAHGAMFAFLSSLLRARHSQEALVHTLYIKAACRIDRFKDAEKIIRESNSYDSFQIKQFLMSLKLIDPLPLIIVCDRFNMIHDLVLYLYESHLMKHIELYVQRINPSRAPEILGALVDVGCGEESVQKMLSTLPHNTFNLETLVREFETKSKLSILKTFLENLAHKGSKDSNIYNALAKIYIDQGTGEQFLLENNNYNFKEIGLYCASRDAKSALIAFERGKCDAELIQLTNDHSMFRQQTKYLTRRRDLTLWKQVFHESNSYCDQVVRETVQTAVPESKDPEEIAVIIKALIGTGKSIALVELLEKLLLESTSFASNKNLQNLLLITAIKCCPEKLSDFLSKLDNYDGADIGKNLIEAGLFEEAHLAYGKVGMKAAATKVLIDNLKDFNRAHQWAIQCNEKDVWSQLGRGQRAAGMLKEAIDSYIRAEDSNDYQALIQLSRQSTCYDEMLQYLQIARVKIRDPIVDNEIIFSLAGSGRLEELSKFISRPNNASIPQVADQCFEAQMYPACKIMYSSCGNHAKLAIALVHLKDFTSALESARRANSMKVWKDLTMSCLNQAEYSLAQQAAIPLLSNPDDLKDIINGYEYRGLFDHIIELLEGSIDKPNSSILTELAIIYAKYKSEKLLPYLEIYWTKLAIPRLISTCEEYHLWKEVVFLYIHHDDFDAAAKCMIQHSTIAFDHDLMIKALQKSHNLDSHYKAIKLYYEEFPKLVSDLLVAIASKLDSNKVIELFKKDSWLIKSYLISIQSFHLPIVNSTLNELALEEEDWEELEASFQRSLKFDTLSFTKRLLSSQNLHFRKLAADLYCSNGKYSEALDLLLKEGLNKDAISIISRANNNSPSISSSLSNFPSSSPLAPLAERLLCHFAEEGHKELFLAVTYSCYNHLWSIPDVVMGLGWKVKGFSELTMPFMCQHMHDSTIKLDRLEKDFKNLTQIR